MDRSISVTRGSVVIQFKQSVWRSLLNIDSASRRSYILTWKAKRSPQQPTCGKMMQSVDTTWISRDCESIVVVGMNTSIWISVTSMMIGDYNTHYYGVNISKRDRNPRLTYGLKLRRYSVNLVWSSATLRSPPTKVRMSKLRWKVKFECLVSLIGPPLFSKRPGKILARNRRSFSGWLMLFLIYELLFLVAEVFKRSCRRLSRRQVEHDHGARSTSWMRVVSHLVRSTDSFRYIGFL